MDDLLEVVFGVGDDGRPARSRRVRLVLRFFFGLLGAGLGAAGAMHFAWREGLTSNVALRASMVAVFVFLACFFLFNVALARTWRWPARLFVASFVLLFVSRIVLGR